MILPLKDVMSMMKLSTIKTIMLKSKLEVNQITIHNNEREKGKSIRVSNVDINNIQGATKVVGGYIQVDSVQVFALFDPTTSHSFIFTDLIKTIERVKCPTRKPLLVQTLVGEIQADQVCSNIKLIINKENFTINHIVLESLDVPMVLGNGWLCAHKGVIYGNPIQNAPNSTVREKN